MRIYQIFTRLFGNGTASPVFNGTRAQNGCGTIDDIGTPALAAIREMGFTHIWLTGLVDHATTTDYSAIDLPPSTASITKGKAGSPYAIRNFFDIAPDLARDPANRMQAFQSCLERIHAAGLKLIMDFVPNHTAREYRPGDTPDPARMDDKTPGFHPDNFYFYLDGQLQLPYAPDYEEIPGRATGNDAFSLSPTVNDWYETVKINYGRDPRTGREQFTPMPRSWGFMTSVLEFWAERGVDGFRCDMVDMVPTGFWKHAISTVRHQHAAVLFVGESYVPANYAPLVEAGFDLLYDKVGLYDALKDRLLGKAKAGGIGKALWDARGHDAHLLHFTENHDEPRLPAKQMFGKAGPAVAMFFLTAVAGRELMLYAGQEFGERAEEAEGFSGADGKTTIFDYWAVPTLHRFYSKGTWTGAELLPQEKVLREQFRQILKLHARLEADGLTILYNLQTANENGYGTASFEDGLALLLSGNSKAVLALANFTSRIERFSVRVPHEAYAHTGKPRIGEELLHISDARTDAQVESLGKAGIRITVTLGAYGCLAVRL